MYQELSGRHSARAESIHIIKTLIVADSESRRPQVQQYAKVGIKFPMLSNKYRRDKKFAKTFSNTRPLNL